MERKGRAGLERGLSWLTVFLRPSASHPLERDVTAPVIPGPVDTVPSRGLHSQLPTCMHMHTYNTGSIYLMFFISHKPNAEY